MPSKGSGVVVAAEEVAEGELVRRWVIERLAEGVVKEHAPDLYAPLRAEDMAGLPALIQACGEPGLRSAIAGCLAPGDDERRVLLSARTSDDQPLRKAWNRGPALTQMTLVWVLAAYRVHANSPPPKLNVDPSMLPLLDEHLRRARARLTRATERAEAEPRTSEARMEFYSALRDHSLAVQMRFQAGSPAAESRALELVGVLHGETAATLLDGLRFGFSLGSACRMAEAVWRAAGRRRPSAASLNRGWLKRPSRDPRILADLARMSGHALRVVPSRP